MPPKNKGRKKRKDYPPDWGCPIDMMRMKKRVLCVYDGQHRLLKDEMMLNHEFEVRMQLGNGNGNAYVTDLDVLTMKRAAAFHDATPDEKGPYPADDDEEHDAVIEELLS